jgi:hypothetical protein
MPYEYRPTAESEYELYSLFALQHRNTDDLKATRFRLHYAGRQCFDLDATRVDIVRQHGGVALSSATYPPWFHDFERGAR